MVFLAYAGLGMLKLFMTFFLSNICELEKEEPEVASSQDPTEESPLLSSNKNTDVAPKVRRLFPSMSKSSGIVLIKLCFLFAIDSFASGLVPQ